MRRKMLGVACVLGGAVALGQGPYQKQVGNALDRNPQLGSGGFNTGGRILPFNSANRITSGNVTGGASFQGFRAIGDPSSFGLSPNPSLPSASLSNFNRDTYSVADVQQGRGPSFQRSEYFSRADTVVNTGGIVAGLNRPGTSQILSPYVTPRVDANRIVPVDPLSSAKNVGLFGVSPRVERLDSGQNVSGPVNSRLLSSPLFGAVREVPVTQIAQQAEQSAGLGASLSTPLDNRIQPEAPMDQRLLPNSAALPNGKLDESPLTRLLGNAPNNGNPDTSIRPPAAGIGAPEPQRNDQLQNPARMPDGMVSVTPLESPTQASDTFTGMRQMLSQRLRTTQTLSDAEKSRREQEARNQIAKRIGPDRKESAVTPIPQRGPVDFVQEAGPLRSFVGTEQSAFNQYLRQAEAMSRSGQYYRAAELYELARTLDPRNPLPLLGRALSLLAAGEYISSSMSLFQAIDIYDALAQFPVDLPSFIPDVKHLDRRRADLEQRLESHEDYRLRFLLGYAEYCSGMQKLGLRNIEKAVAQAPAEQEFLRRFAAALALRPLGAASRPAL